MKKQTLDQTVEKNTIGEINLDYYNRECLGRLDYWEKMAAPRSRVENLLRLLSEIRPKSLVDLGCGAGQLLDAIHEKFSSVKLSGIDLSEKQVKENARLNPSISWYALDLEKNENVADVIKDRFDVIVASELIEHLDNDAQFLHRIKAMAVPGSTYLLITTQSGKIRATEKIVGHHRHYSRQEMERLIDSSGWEPLRVWNTGYPFHNLSKYLANLAPENTIHIFNDRPYGFKENFVCWALRVLFKFNSSHRGAQLYALAKLRGA